MRRTLALVAVLVLVATACAEDDASLGIDDVWSRVSTGENGAVYMVISGGDADAALIGVAVGTDVAAMAQIHESSMNSDGAMSMSMIPQLEIPAGADVVLAPGGVHVMLMGLADSLEEGDTFEVTLTFDNGTERTVTAEVRDE
jgi:copper(I)-binding protein